MNEEDKTLSHDIIGFSFIKKYRKKTDSVLCEIWKSTNEKPPNSWKKIESFNQNPNPMDKYRERRLTCKHDKGLTYGHCETLFGVTTFDIVCDWCLYPLYRTGGFLDVKRDPRLKQFVDIPEDERKAHATASLLFKVEQKIQEENKKE